MGKTEDTLFRERVTKSISGGMAVKGIRQTEMASQLGISQPEFSRRLKRGEFKSGQLMKMFMILETDRDEISGIFKPYRT
jgi:predicted XRE-type DNA-binding protein